MRRASSGDCEGSLEMKIDSWRRTLTWLRNATRNDVTFRSH